MTLVSWIRVSWFDNDRNFFIEKFNRKLTFSDIIVKVNQL